MRFHSFSVIISAMKPKTQKIIKIISIIICIAILSLIAYITVKFALDKENFKVWMTEHALLGRLAYIGMIVLQILVAVVPGGPIELAGGYTFGAVEGTILFTIGAFIGSLLVFGLVRKFGRKFVEIYFKEHEIKKLKFLLDDKKRDIIFMILFVIPGTPKDLLCYIAGLTPMKAGIFIMIATFGRLPAVIGTAISGSEFGSANYLTAIIAFVITITLSGLGILIYYKLVNRKQKADRD